MNPVVAMYNQAGAEAFSKMLCQMAPYFSTINPVMTQLRPGYAEASLPFRKEVTNHLGTVHAIAMCNAAELVAGTMTNVTIPEGARWIPQGMSVKYLAKAKTSLRAVADGSQLDWTSAGEKVVPVAIFDEHEQLVCSAEITMNVKLV
jgi:uncharacterized protein (TIGR00369 family)